ncbi:MAG TPA: hypothetical protein VG966_03375 [Hyphomicrobiaceae bacterium]|nr:hypothetical protein [Hyphomicrobiaceae bacterium]
MPQLVGLMLIGAGLYAGYRALMRAAGKVIDELGPGEAELRQHSAVTVKDLGALEYDPTSGVYRPARRV